MKKMLFLVMFGCLLSISGCQERTVVVPVDGAIRILREELNDLSTDQFKERYKILPAVTKAALWADKFDQVLTFEWNVAQRRHLIAAKATAIESTFSGSDVSVRKRIQSLKAEGLVLFNYAEYKQFVTDLDDFSKVKYTANARTAKSENSCECSTSDTWCGGDECGLFGGACNVTTKGCGWLLLENCNGKCEEEDPREG